MCNVLRCSIVLNLIKIKGSIRLLQKEERNENAIFFVPFSSDSSSRLFVEALKSFKALRRYFTMAIVLLFHVHIILPNNSNTDIKIFHLKVKFAQMVHVGFFFFFFFFIILTVRSASRGKMLILKNYVILNWIFVIDENIFFSL